MSEQMRKEFEQKYISRFFLGRAVNLDDEELDCYQDIETQEAYKIWQASRQSLVVKLPRVTGDAAYDAAEVLDALDAAGVKYE